jgi:ACS family glucarate transporter-like MFS transporter
MSFVLYLDRVCMGQAVKPIKEEFEITENWRMSVILMAFTLAYGLFEVPTGRMGDRYGVRRVLTRIVIWWSLFTMLTGACWGFWSLVVVRFLFGAGEAGAYPNAARVITRWFPLRERGRVQGLMLTSGLVGGSLSPALAAYIIEGFGWRTAFTAFGLVGVVWAIAFFFWFADDPARHPGVNELERDLIGTAGPSTEHRPIPWSLVLRNRSIWLLAAIICCSAFVSYVYFSWYPNYLQSARGVSQVRAGELSSLVLAGGAAGTLGGGFVVDFLARRRSMPRRIRQYFCCVAMIIAAAVLALAVLSDESLVSASLASVSLFAMLLFQSTWWSTAIEVSGPHTGALFGLMNGIGAIGAMSSQLFFGAFPDWREKQGYVGRDQWDPAFWVCVALLLVAAVMWLGVDSRKRIGDDHSPASGIGGNG